MIQNNLHVSLIVELMKYTNLYIYIELIPHNKQLRIITIGFSYRMALFLPAICVLDIASAFRFMK